MWVNREIATPILQERFSQRSLTDNPSDTCRFDADIPKQGRQEKGHSDIHTRTHLANQQTLDFPTFMPFTFESGAYDLLPERVTYLTRDRCDGG